MIRAASMPASHAGGVSPSLGADDSAKERGNAER